ncbi:MAG: MarR family transcriptional regulator [Clostridia bacterium]|nr:MarR family transcriptional regulator [Clostridia bacterium]NLS84124.1 winged helix-turn-helix transcriptional regulator [Oscillospiraceae bacterium]
MKCDHLDEHALRMFKCANEFVAAWHSITPDDAVSKRQFHALGTIAFMQHTRKCGITTSDLAAKIGVSLPAVSQNVSTLVDFGLLERVPDKDDRRVLYLKITKQGDEAMHNAMKKLLGYLDEATAGMNCDALCENLTQFTAAVHKVAEMTNKGETKPNA